MALSNEEFEKLKSQLAARQSVTSVPQRRGVVDDIKNVGIGAAKGLTETAVGTARLLHTGGEFIQAAVDPTRTLSETRAMNADGSVLKGEDADQIDAQLKVDNGMQKGGKAAAFIAELLYPAGLVSKATGASKIAGAAIDGIGSRAASITDDVIGGTGSIKDRLVESISTLDDKTKTALQRTPKDVFDRFVKQAEDASIDDRIRTPLEAVGDAVMDGLKTVATKASEIGQSKSELMKINGITPFKGDGIKRFNEGLQSFLNNKRIISEDKTVFQAIQNEFKKLGNTPSAGQVDKFIDFAQDKLYSAERNLTLPTSSGTSARLKGLIGKLNEDLKNQLPVEYRQLNDAFSRLQGLKEELNTKLGKEGGSAGSFVKRLFSPSDARTKELFDLLQQETGEDYFRDARIAKFVMDVFGDTRAKSLLEELPTDTVGMIGKIVEYGRKKLSDPIKAAERIIKRNEK